MVGCNAVQARRKMTIMYIAAAIVNTALMIRRGHLKTVQLRQNLSVIVAYYIEINKI